jgi:hypothetical protein
VLLFLFPNKKHWRKNNKPKRRKLNIQLLEDWYISLLTNTKKHNVYIVFTQEKKRKTKATGGSAPWQGAEATPGVVEVGDKKKLKVRCVSYYI